MFRLNPSAACFIPRTAQLVRQVAVPSRRVSFYPTLVTDVKVFLFTEGSEARSNPTGKSRLMKINYKRLDSNEGSDSHLPPPPPAPKALPFYPQLDDDDILETCHVASNVCDDWLTVMGTTETEDLEDLKDLHREIEIMRQNLNYCE